MSGALIQLVSRGPQDVYLMNDEGHSFFRTKFVRHTNFSQAPKHIKTFIDQETTITIPVLGDLINSLWLEGSNKIRDMFRNSVIDLYVGGQVIDSQHFDYFADIWPNYLSDTYSKSQTFSKESNFIPLHFFFCDHKAFLPLIALQNHEVSVKITFDENNLHGLTEDEKRINLYGNYIFLDKLERESILNRQLDLVITQVRRSQHSLNTSDGYNSYDLRHLKHPVKSIFFGFNSLDEDHTKDFFKFSTADLYFNGTTLFENMSPLYFHSVQNYYKSNYGKSNFDSTPLDTRYYAYHFCMNASDYNPSGSCNFSRLDHAKLIIRGASMGPSRPDDQLIFIYATNYNVLRIKNGMAGILFGN